MFGDDGLHAFLSGLDAHDTISGLWPHVVAFFARHRVDGVIHVLMFARPGDAALSPRVLDSLGGATERLCAVDGGWLNAVPLSRVLAGRSPCLMGLAPPDECHGDNPSPAVLDRVLAACGFRAVLSLPLMVGSRCQGPAGFVLLSRQGADTFGGAVRAEGGTLVLAAHHAHDRLMRLADVPDGLDPVPNLTSREGEVLTLSARGLTTRQLGQHMGISVSAVNFHLANAARKLNANNRTHAVSRAMTLGLITP